MIKNFKTRVQEKEVKAPTEIIETNNIRYVVQDIPLTDIVENKNQPRKEFNKEDIKKLANSIKEFGLLEPIGLIKVGRQHMIIHGERRFRAHKLLNKETIPSIIRHDLGTEDTDLEILALVENVLRKDLNALEIGESIYRLKDRKVTQRKIGQVLGYDESTVSKYIQSYTIIKDDSIKREKFKHFGMEKGYIYFCQKKDIKNNQNKLKGKRLGAIHIENEKDKIEIKRKHKRVKDFLMYLEGLLQQK